MENISIESKTGHSKSILSCDFFKSGNKSDYNIFATNSEDKTIRVWDLRVKKCPKFFKNNEITENMSNLIFNNNYIYTGCDNNIFVFDIRSDKIINNNYFDKQVIHNEEITSLSLCSDGKNIFFSDDGFIK